MRNFRLDLDVNGVQVVTITLTGAASGTGDTGTAFSNTDFMVLAVPDDGSVIGGKMDSNVVAYVVDANTVGVKTVDGAVYTGDINVICMGEMA